MVFEAKPTGPFRINMTFENRSKTKPLQFSRRFQLAQRTCLTSPLPRLPAMPFTSLSGDFAGDERSKAASAVVKTAEFALMPIFTSRPGALTFSCLGIPLGNPI